MPVTYDARYGPGSPLPEVPVQYKDVIPAVLLDNSLVGRIPSGLSVRQQYLLQLFRALPLKFQPEVMARERNGVVRGEDIEAVYKMHGLPLIRPQADMGVRGAVDGLQDTTASTV